MGNLYGFVDSSCWLGLPSCWLDSRQQVRQLPAAFILLPLTVDADRGRRRVGEVPLQERGACSYGVQTPPEAPRPGRVRTACGGLVWRGGCWSRPQCAHPPLTNELTSLVLPGINSCSWTGEDNLCRGACVEVQLPNGVGTNSTVLDRHHALSRAGDTGFRLESSPRSARIMDGRTTNPLALDDARL